jgi:DNA-directed RNA polymerase specialized sigma24 family protein
MNAIVQLPMQYQRVANQFFIQEKSHEEISNYLSIPIGSVKGTIHRAKDMLRKRLSNL